MKKYDTLSKCERIRPKTNKQKLDLCFELCKKRHTSKS